MKDSLQSNAVRSDVSATRRHSVRDKAHKLSGAEVLDDVV